MNRYCSALLLLMLLSFGIGGDLLFSGWFWSGLLILIPGGLIASGFRILSPGDGDKPRQVGVLTVLGQRTYCKVEGLTLGLNPFGFDIIGITAFDIKKLDKSFPITSVRCHDNVRMKGMVSVSVMPDEDDDRSCVPEKDRRSGAHKLWEWFDIGGFDGYWAQVNDIIAVGVQEIVVGEEEGLTEDEKNARTYKWAETHPTAIAVKLLTRIKAHRQIGDTDELDDTRGLGGKIKKIQVELTPINTAVITADEDRVIEELQQVSELKETETINKQTVARIKLYTDAGLPDVSAKACRDEIMFERLAKDKKVTITQGGRIVNVGSVGNTDHEPRTERAGAIAGGGR